MDYIKIQIQPTANQKKYINMICKKLNITFIGETKQDAQKFISIFKKYVDPSKPTVKQIELINKINTTLNQSQIPDSKGLCSWYIYKNMQRYKELSNEKY